MFILFDLLFDLLRIVPRMLLLTYFSSLFPQNHLGTDGNRKPHDFRPTETIDIDDDWQRNERGVTALRGLDGSVMDADGDRKAHDFRPTETIDIDDDWQRNERGVTALRGLDGSVIGKYKQWASCMISNLYFAMRLGVPSFFPVRCVVIRCTSDVQH